MSSTPCKETFIERIFGRLYDATVKDVKSTILVISIMLNIYQNITHIEYVESSSDRLITEVKKRVDERVPSAVSKEVEKQMQPISETIDTASSKLDQIADKIIGK